MPTIHRPICMQIVAWRLDPRVEFRHHYINDPPYHFMFYNFTFCMCVDDQRQQAQGTTSS